MAVADAKYIDGLSKSFYEGIVAYSAVKRMLKLRRLSAATTARVMPYDRPLR